MGGGLYDSTLSKLVTFHHYRVDTKHSPILSSDHTFKKASHLECLVRLKLTTDIKQNAYIRVIAKDAGTLTTDDSTTFRKQAIYKPLCSSTITTCLLFTEFFSFI